MTVKDRWPYKTSILMNCIKCTLHKVAIQGRWPFKTVTVNDRFYCIYIGLVFQVEISMPVIYDSIVKNKTGVEEKLIKEKWNFLKSAVSSYLYECCFDYQLIKCQKNKVLKAYAGNGNILKK